MERWEQKRKKVGTESSEGVERELKEKHIFDTSPTCSGAAEPEAGPAAEVLKSAASRYCFIRYFHSTTSKTSMGLRPILFSLKKWI